MLVNRLTVTGNAGQDPDFNYTPSGKAVAKFNVAVYQGKDAQGNSLTMWLRVIAWEKLAERVSEHVRKGMEVYVEGRLTIQFYTDKTGQQRQSIEIIATAIQPTQRQKQAVSVPADAGYDSLGELDDHPF